MTVTILKKLLRVTCVIDPTNPWDLDLNPFPTAEKDYNDAIAFLQKSAKASGFIKQIVDSTHNFNIMVTDNYMNKYWSPGELATVYKTKFDGEGSLITWNSKERGEWFAIADHQPPDFDVPASHPSVQNNKSPSPAILLIHEFGHGLQYLKNKSGYEALRTASYNPDTGKDVDTKIEDENVRMHEAPVCLELNEQVRWKYWDNEKPKVARPAQAVQSKPKSTISPPKQSPVVPVLPNLRGLGPREPQTYSNLGVGRKESLR